MKVRVRADGYRFFVPIPLSLASLTLRCVGRKYITPEQKQIVLASLKVIRKELKKYKGLTIVEVETASGEYISIKV